MVHLYHVPMNADEQALIFIYYIYVIKSICIIKNNEDIMGKYDDVRQLRNCKLSQTNSTTHIISIL